MEKYNFLLVGVGGQGTILASNIIAEAGLALGLDVKKAEIHGMSQRGGSVISHVRWAEKVYSPIVAEGEADFILAFEKLEALRYIEYLKPNGTVIINDYSIIPLSVKTSDICYPDNNTIQTTLQCFTNRIFWINGIDLAQQIGNVKTTNVILIGALSALMQDNHDHHWHQAIEKFVPTKMRKENIEAFHNGKNAIHIVKGSGLSISEKLESQ